MKFETFKWSCTCPFCGQHQQAATTVSPDPPKDGDMTLCMRCGEWAAFDSSSEGGLRKPTHAEYEHLAKDETAIFARNAWVNIDKQRRQEKEEQAKPKAKAKEMPPPNKEKLSAMLDQGFEQIFKGMFCNRPMPPAVERALKRAFMAGVLTCYERAARIGEMDDEEGVREWRRMKNEIAEFCAETIVSLVTTKKE
jgi:hypothetical protein